MGLFVNVHAARDRQQSTIEEGRFWLSKPGGIVHDEDKRHLSMLGKQAVKSPFLEVFGVC